jgi:hypothetical protein
LNEFSFGFYHSCHNEVEEAIVSLSVVGGKGIGVAEEHLKYLEHKKKNLVNKNQGWEPIHLKYKVNENTSRHNPKKNKSKQSTN